MWYNSGPLMEPDREGVNRTSAASQGRLPRVVTRIDLAIAALFCLAGAYHFTQPNQAWRSGVIETTCAAALVVAACWLGWRLASLVHVAVGLGVAALGIRHLVIGSGWRSGTMELVMAAVLLGLVVVIFRHRPAKG